MTHRNRGGDGSIDAYLEEYKVNQRRQQIFRMLSEMGQGLIEANRSGQSPIRGLSAGLAQGMAQGRSGGDMISMLREREIIERIGERQQAAQQGRGQHAMQEALTAGNRYDPRNQILWNTPPAPGREPPPMTPGQFRGVAAQAYPEAYNKAFSQGLMAEMFPGLQERFEDVKNPYGLGGVGQRSSKTGQISGYQKPAKSTMSDRKLALVNKFRAAQDGRAEWTDADQAEWDMIVRADPMDILRRGILQGMGRDSAATTSSPGSAAPASPAASAEDPSFFDDPLGYFFGPSAEARQPAPGGNGAAAPAPRRQAAPVATAPGASGAPSRPRGPRGGRPVQGRERVKPIPRMSITEIDDLVANRGDSLSPAELKAVQARLAALGAR